MARCAAPAPALLIVAVLLMFFSAQLVQSCVPMDDPCGPAYWCCDCDPVTNKKLSCSLAWRSGSLKYVCATYAFEPTCNSLGIEEAFGLPRKLRFSANQQVKIDASNTSDYEAGDGSSEDGLKDAALVTNLLL